jgi:hypothetical protein
MRANLKKRLKDQGTPLAILLLLDPPMDLETMKVYNLLLATRKFGKVKSQKYLRAVAISPSKTVGGLSQRQRSELVRVLRTGL